MKPSHDVPDRAGSARKPASLPSPKWKRWSFRLAALVLPPLALLLIAELLLRAFGFGYPTSFLLNYAHNGGVYFTQNNQFGRRFFGRQMARAPKTFCIPQVKADHTVRIFVFGESAAFGDPQPAFGLARMLQALLELRHPGTKFEVVNAAMTGINSHVILPIAQDCARAEADAWVLYIGNNEVVGPFGAGTVFGARTPPRQLIRANLALKTLRTGQLVQSLLERKQEQREWGGMTMFLHNQVSADDPRMTAVYANFDQNLRDIIAAAARHGTRVVASTVAVNLKDCAPFGSAHRAGLSEADLRSWDELWRRGQAALAAADYSAAAAAFRQAVRLDDAFAALRFALGAVLMESGQRDAATAEYRAARELDTLRFRCDPKLNDVTRRVAGQSPSENVALVDAEEAFGRAASDGLPGNELFYDHVHLTFEGNYLLAKTIAPAVENQLAGTLSPAQSWPTLADCARRLCWSDFYRREAGLEMLRRLSDPPFTTQLNHPAQLNRLEKMVASLSDAAKPEQASATLRACESVRARYPQDPELCLLSALLANAVGDGKTTVDVAQKALDLLPVSGEACSLLAAGYEKQHQFEKAVGAYDEVLLRDPQAFYALNSLGRVYIALMRTNEAVAAYRKAVELKPLFGPAWLSLGELLPALGQASEAQTCISNALRFPIRSPSEYKRLAQFCQKQGWPGAAATNYAQAVEMDPTDVAARLEAGQCFGATGNSTLAEQWFAEAVRLAPDSGPAHFLYGRSLGMRGDVAGAEAQFRSAAQLMPDVQEARLNLALSLARQGRTADAIHEYEALLERWPGNQIARNNLERLRAATPAKSP